MDRERIEGHSSQVISVPMVIRYERPKSKDGFGPKKRLWFPVTSPVCRNSQNPSSITNVLRQESEGEVTLGETEVPTVVTDLS